MRVLDLFSGIGGISLGLEAAGMTTVMFCESDVYCRKVLAKHWPNVPIHDDVRTLRKEHIDGSIDIICGGFPCQPFSIGGSGHARRLGAEDDRHLWPEFARIVQEFRPSWVLGENVIGLRDMELDNVLAGLEGMGYSTRTFDIPACSVGAIHERRRLWIVAYAQNNGCEGRVQETIPRESPQSGRLDQRMGEVVSRRSDLPQPHIVRGSNGLSKRLHALGNSVVPQIPFHLGRLIVAATYGVQDE